MSVADRAFNLQEGRDSHSTQDPQRVSGYLAVAPGLIMSAADEAPCEVCRRASSLANDE